MQRVFLARQPIYDRDLFLHAYEVLYRSGEENRANVGGPNGIRAGQATSQVLLNVFMEFGVDKVAGGHPVFINVSEEILLNCDLELPTDNVVLEVLENVEPTPAVVEAVFKLKERGFLIALDDFEFSPPWEPLLKIADIVKLDVLSLGPQKSIELAKFLKKYPAKLLAEKVETKADFDVYREAGFDYFQGYFFARPKLISTQRPTGRAQSVIELLSMVRKPDVDVARLEQRIKMDMALSYRLLRYINSPFFAIPYPVESVRQAIALLGLRALTNWVTLLALANIDDKPSELMSLALARAKTCELLAPAIGRRDADAFFTAGLFSLLDAMMDTAIDVVLKELPLSEEIVDGILNEAGTVGSVLKCAKALEIANLEAAEAALPEAKATFHQAHSQALRWADDVLQGMRSG